MNTSTAVPPRQNLYFIAALIPSPFSEELTSFKRIIAEKYGSREALKVDPHFTLKAPFKIPAVWHEKLLQWFQAMSINTCSFLQVLNGFGAFHNKYSPVIYAKPDNPSELGKLQKEIISHFEKSRLRELLHTVDNSYKPHATVAYRDLNPSAFEQAWLEFATKDYYASFDVNSFHLLQHNGKVWQSISEYRLVADKPASK